LTVLRDSYRCFGIVAITQAVVICGYSAFSYGAVGASRKFHQKLILSYSRLCASFHGRIVARCAPLADDLEALRKIIAAVFLNSLLRVLCAGPPALILGLVSRHTFLLPSASQLKFEVSRPLTLIVEKGNIVYLGTSGEHSSIQRQGIIQTESLKHVDQYIHPARAFHD